MLVRHAADLGVLKQLRVEAHHLGADGGDRHEPPQPVDPGEGRRDPVLEAGSQPASGPAPVEEAGLAVAGFPLPSAAAAGPPTEQGIADGLPPMGQLARPNDPPGRFGYHRDARGLGARVELEPMGMGDALGNAALGEPDRERVAPPHSGFPVVEQLPRPRRVARVERLAVAAEDKDERHDFGLLQLPSRG